MVQCSAFQPRPLSATPTNRSANASTANGETVLYEGLVYCAVPSWSDFQFHFVVCIASFCVMVALSLALSLCRISWKAEECARVLRPVVRGAAHQRVYLLTVFLFSLFTCILQIWRANAGDGFGNILSADTMKLFNMLEIVGCLIHLVESLVVWSYKTANISAWTVVFGRLFVDCFLVPSMMVREFGSQQSHFAFAYFASLRVFGSWNAYRSTLSIYHEGVAAQILHSVVMMVIFVFFVSMMLQQLETLDGKPWPVPTSAESNYPAQRWSMDSSVYFVVMTVTTVGFGDLWPQSVLGEIATIFIAVRGLYLLVESSMGILDAVLVGWGGGGVYEKSLRSKHVVVTGNPSYQMLVDFIQELYHEENMRLAEDINCVILLTEQPDSPLRGLKRFFDRVQNRYLKHRVWILQGSAINRLDLERAGLKDAAMAWLLPNIYAEDAQREDVDNSMRALAMLRHAKFVRLVVVTLRSENRLLASSVGVPDSDILVASDLKIGMLGKACQAQGWPAWAAILLKRHAKKQQLKYDVKRPWLQSFTESLNNDVHEVKLSAAYIGAPFGAVAVDILERSGGKAFLIGFMEEAVFPGDMTTTQVFPGRSVHIGLDKDKQLKGIYIAANRDDIRQQSDLEHFAYAGFSQLPTAPTTGIAIGSGHLPNAVPEPLAANGTQGYVRQWYELEAEKLSSTDKLMVAASKLRVAKGVQMHANVSRAEAEWLVGGVPANAEELLENGGGGANDSAQALLNQHLEAQREAEREAEVILIEMELKASTKNLARYRKALDVVEVEEELRWQSLKPNIDEQEVDDELWGSEPPPPLALYGSPREPPLELLVRGGHVMVLALDVNASTSGDLGDGSPTISGKRQQAERPPGNKHGLKELVDALHTGHPRHRVRPLVVLAAEVPADWPDIADKNDVYLVMGPPLMGSVLHRGGLEQAAVVVVHQLSVCVTDDPSTVDSQAVFACRLVESLLSAAGKDIPVVCDMVLPENTFFVPHIERKIVNGWAHVVDRDAVDQDKDDKDEESAKERRMQGIQESDGFYTQTRFATGQLFVSSIVTRAAANMMYSPYLASIFRELVRAGYLVLPLDDDFVGSTYGDVFITFLKRRNVLPIGLLRKIEYDESDGEDEEEEPPDITTKKGAAAAEEKARAQSAAKAVRDERPPEPRWTPSDPPSRRIVLACPAGNFKIAQSDGVICMLPTDSKPLLPPWEELVRPYCA